MRKNRVSAILDRNDVVNNALTRTAYRVTYMTLYPVYYVHCMLKRIRELRSM